MTKGKTKQEINCILQKIEENYLTFCEGEKEIFKIIDKLFERDTYNYYQCNDCESEDCEAPCN